MAQERLQVNYSRAFKKVLPDAEKYLRVESFVTTWYSKDILNDFEYAEVEAEGNKVKKTRKVFQFVMIKDLKYQEMFVADLDHAGTEHWAKRIREIAGVDGGPQAQNHPSPEENEPRNRLEDKPSSIELLDAVVPKVATRWDDLSTRLDLEDEGRIIGQDYNKVTDRCRHVLRAWTDGKGLKPVTWETLLSVIERCGYKDLAAELEERLKRGQKLEE